MMIKISIIVGLSLQNWRRITGKALWYKINRVNHSLKYNKNRNQHIIIINDFNIRTQKENDDLYKIQW